MKIAYLSTFYPYRGGIAQFNADLYREFEKKHEVLAYNFKRQYPDLLFPGKTQYVTENDLADAIPNQRILDSLNPLSYLRAAHKIKSVHPDLLLTRFWLPFFGPSLGTVARRLRCNKIAILDNVIPHEGRLGDRALTKYFLNAFDGFVVMSSEVEEDLNTFRPEAPRIFHRHPPYDHFPDPIDKQSAREKLGIKQGQKVLLFFGFIRSYKGLDLLIDALKELSEDYVLLIAGECYGDFTPYEEQIARNGLKDRVIIHNRYIDDDEVPLFYCASDLSMLTYKNATQSGVVSISYHYKLPVLVTDVGGLREVVEPFNSGIVVDEPEPHLIAEGVRAYFVKGPTPFISGIDKHNKESSWESLANSIEEFNSEL